MTIFFFSTRSSDHRDLHSFPTRRSSDLDRPACGDGELWIRKDKGQGRTRIRASGSIHAHRRAERLRHRRHRSHPRSEETRLNSSHSQISYAVFCLKKKKKHKKHKKTNIT